MFDGAALFVSTMRSPPRTHAVLELVSCVFVPFACVQTQSIAKWQKRSGVCPAWRERVSERHTAHVWCRRFTWIYSCIIVEQYHRVSNGMIFPHVCIAHTLMVSRRASPGKVPVAFRCSSLCACACTSSLSDTGASQHTHRASRTVRNCNHIFSVVFGRNAKYHKRRHYIQDLSHRTACVWTIFDYLVVGATFTEISTGIDLLQSNTIGGQDSRAFCQIVAATI